jgi:lambda family phage tail tape measure protein
MGDALARFVTTGKLDFKSLADAIISDLIRIQLQAIRNMRKKCAQALEAKEEGEQLHFFD